MYGKKLSPNKTKQKLHSEKVDDLQLVTRKEEQALCRCFTTSPTQKVEFGSLLVFGMHYSFLF